MNTAANAVANDSGRCRRAQWKREQVKRASREHSCFYAFPRGPLHTEMEWAKI
jgi:hypothetical protein